MKMSMTELPPTPWRITDTGSAYKITDAQGRGVAWVYYRREEALRGDYMTQEQAREMAVQIARLSKPSDSGPSSSTDF